MHISNIGIKRDSSWDFTQSFAALTHPFANGSSFTVFQMEQLHTAERSQRTASHAIRVPPIMFDEPDPNLPFLIVNLKFKIPHQVKGDSPHQTSLSLESVENFRGKKKIAFGLLDYFHEDHQQLPKNNSFWLPIVFIKLRINFFFMTNWGSD